MYIVMKILKKRRPRQSGSKIAPCVPAAYQKAHKLSVFKVTLLSISARRGVEELIMQSITRTSKVGEGESASESIPSNFPQGVII